MTASGVGGAAAAALRLLLCSDTEFLAARVVAPTPRQWLQWPRALMAPADPLRRPGARARGLARRLTRGGAGAQLARGERARAAVGLEGERRALQVAVAACERELAAAATTLEEDEAVLAALESAGSFGAGERENAVRYRAARKRLLCAAAAAMRERERLSADAGEPVDAAADSWLEAQQHEQRRHLHNLGF